MKSIKNYFKKQWFNPGFLGVFINPFWIARRRLWSAMQLNACELSGVLLDVGCGTKPYQSLFKVEKYIGLEYDSLHCRNLNIADYFYSGNLFPFDSNSIDSVLCNQVLEHVFNPDDFLKEIHRVLKYDGKILLTVPFIWDEHEQPFDYARYSSFGLEYILKKNGFEIIKSLKLSSDFSAIAQLIIAYIYKIIPNNNTPLKIRMHQLIYILVFAPITIIGVLISKILPKSTDFFLDQTILAKKV
jgi:SAM-dependent methyltransferase